jgi:hypothetical protein
MSEVTRIPPAMEQGDAGGAQAAAQLLPLVYDELRRLAAHQLAQERPGQTLQATASVHGAYLRLAGSEPDVPWNSRGHFMAAAVEAVVFLGFDGGAAGVLQRDEPVPGIVDLLLADFVGGCVSVFVEGEIVRTDLGDLVLGVVCSVDLRAIRGDAGEVALGVGRIALGVRRAADGVVRTHPGPTSCPRRGKARCSLNCHLGLHTHPRLTFSPR